MTTTPAHFIVNASLWGVRIEADGIANLGVIYRAARASRPADEDFPLAVVRDADGGSLGVLDRLGNFHLSAISAASV